MSFDSRFESRWAEIIEPAIREIGNDIPVRKYRGLLAHRVDRTKTGNSILVEILEQVARCRLLIADVTTLLVNDGVPLRPANVLYEVGVAHSIRLPEEVLLFRSDSDPLPFDIANVRVHSYSPESDPETARGIVQDTVLNALQEIDLTRHAAVQRAADILDVEAFDMLADSTANEGAPHPTSKVARDKTGWLRAVARFSAAQQLLAMGAIETQYTFLGRERRDLGNDREFHELFSYKTTEFGEQVYVVAARRIIGEQ